MGTIEVKEHYKTKAILAIFAWHVKVKGFNKHKCGEIMKIAEEFEGEFVEREEYEKRVFVPFELFEREGKIRVSDLKFGLLLMSKGEQGMRIDLFKELTRDPEQLFNFFRFKFFLIYRRIPEYLIGLKLLDPGEGDEFIKRKMNKIQLASNEKYLRYTTSSCNVLKLTILRT